MDTKTLASAIIGFLLGGLVVSIATTQLDTDTDTGDSDMSMGQSADLRDKSGDAYDAAFIAGMIEHHDGAIAMAELSATRAEHTEVKRLSKDIIAAQEREILEMKRWQQQWGYDASGEQQHSMN